MRVLTKTLKTFFGFEDQLNKRQQLHKGTRLRVEQMEDRVVPATIFDGGSTAVTIGLAANESLSVVSNGSSYQFQSNLSFSNSGVAATGDFSAFGGTSLTLQSSGLARYDTIRIVDSGANTRVTFDDSAANPYSDNISVVLDDPLASTVTFNGSTIFSATNTFDVSTARNISINPGATIRTDSGNIALWANQQATPTGGNFDGINVTGDATRGVSIGSNSGAITLKGRSGTSGGSGIWVHGSDNAAPALMIGKDTTGAVTLVGTAPNGVGVQVGRSGTSIVTSGGGDVSVTGYGSSAGVLTYGAYSPGKITAGGSGTVTVVGFGTGTGSNSYGVLLDAGTITSSGGNVSVTGTGGGNINGNGNDNYGVYNRGVISAGGMGNVTVTGTGGRSVTGSSNSGVYLYYIGAQITSSGGDITVTGTGGEAAGNFNHGVSLSYGGQIKAGGLGSVTVTGMGGNTTGTLRGDANNGVDVDGANGGIITTSGGNVSITGTGGGNINSYSNNGVRAWNIDAGTQATSITAGGNGTVTVVGQGSKLSMDSQGVLVSSNTRIASGGGDVSVTGTAGLGQGNQNVGVQLDDRGVIMAGGMGNVTVTGTGGNTSGVQNHGVQIGNLFSSERSGSITSNGGNISVTGTSGSGTGTDHYGIKIRSLGSISTLISGNVTLTANSIDLGGSINAQTRNVTIQPMTAGTPINIGTSLTAGSLWLRNSSLGSNVTAGTINIGNTDTAAITVSAPITRTATTALNFTTAVTTGVRPTANGTDLNLAGGAFSLSSGSDLILNIGGLVLDTGYQQLKVNGDVNINGLDLVLTGAFVSSAGNNFVIVSATSITGKFNNLAENAIVPFNGRALRVNYTATTVTLTDSGVYNPNSPPTIARDLANVTVNEGSTATNTGTFNDAEGNNTVTLTASIGNVTKDNATGTWSWSYTGDNGPAGPTSVTITATDDFNEIATTTFSLTIDNVAPTTTIGSNGPVTYGDSFTVDFSDSFDPSGEDTTAGFRYAFSLTDDFTGITYATGSSSPSQAFTQNAGTYTVYARIIDQDDGFTQYSIEVTVAKADAVVTVNGYNGTYDTLSHGATGSATGVGGVDLSGWLSLGSSFTNAPGGTANWSFSGGSNYNDQSGSVAIDIAKADQTISWSDPSGIVYGVTLTGTQLNATVAVISGGTAAGALSYTTPAGTILNAGNHQALTVTAAATTNYNATSRTVYIDVATVALTVTANSVARVYSTSTPGFSVTYSGFVNGDNAGSLGGTLTFTPSNTSTLAPGTYTLTPSGLTSANYTISYIAASLTIVPIGVVDGKLIIVGTDGRDIISVTKHGSVYRVDARLAAQWIDHSDDHDWDDNNDDDDDDDCYEHTSRHQHFTFNAADVTSLQIFGLGGNDKLRVGRTITISAYIDGGAGDDRIWSGGGDDTIVDMAGNNRIHTRQGTDTVTTGNGNDRVWTDGGGDFINVGDGCNEVHAGGGNNTIIAGSGNDDIWSRDGNDYIDAGNGNNDIHSGDGDDTIITGSGNDNIWSDGGDDTINAGDGNNQIRSGSGNDYIITGSGNDLIDAGAGDDFIRAGAGNDTVQGGAGDDIIVGGDGDDLLMGGNGRDLIIGGAGADRIVGNQDDDILIAGYTSFDSNNIALLALMSEWTSDSSYAVRVAHITNGGGANGAYRLINDGASQTVFDDSSADTLTGSQGTDWFFASVDSDTVTDKTAKELWDDTEF